MIVRCTSKPCEPLTATTWVLSRHCRRIAIIIAIASSMLAQQPYGERIEVNITNVDVVVTDRGGAHVHGLTKDDFEVLDSGVPQAVTNFTRTRGGAAPGGTGAATGRPPDPSARAPPDA